MTLQASTIKFLKDLGQYNSKEWFEAHRQKYENARLDFETFIGELIRKHALKDPEIGDLTAKKCMFRINRDVRFSKNKLPYKTNMGASINRGGKKSVFAGYYFHLEPGESFIGGGVWMPMPGEVKKIRQEIDYCWKEFEHILNNKKFQKFYGQLYTGEDVSLVKVPAGFEKDNPAAAFLKLKSWLAMKELTDAEITSPELAARSIE